MMVYPISEILSRSDLICNNLLQSTVSSNKKGETPISEMTMFAELTKQFLSLSNYYIAKKGEMKILIESDKEGYLTP